MWDEIGGLKIMEEVLVERGEERIENRSSMGVMID